MRGRFTLLENGLHYRDPDSGAWLPSQDLIESFPDGAIARYGPIRAIFSHDLNAESVFDLETPAGARLRGGLRALARAGGRHRDRAGSDSPAAGPRAPLPQPGCRGLERRGVCSEWTDRRSIQWFRLTVGAGGLTDSAHGRIDDASSNPDWYHFPSLNVNAAGDLLVGFSGSRATEYIGAFYRARKANGTWMPRPGLIQTGRGAGGSDRWGDYSATTVDSTSDPNDPSYGSFWTVQEYADPVPIAPWGTWIMQVKSNQ